MMQTAKAPFGGAVKTLLHAHGIPAAEVVRRQQETVYTVSFFNPEMAVPTKPARVWAQEITSKFSGITVIEKVDTVAPWRQGAPVIEAMVQFRGVPIVANVGLLEQEWRSEFNLFMCLG